MRKRIIEKTIIVLMSSLIILSGCSINKYRVDSFDTWEEAIEITMNALEDRYPDDEFKIYVDEDGKESVEKSDYGSVKVVVMYVESKKFDGCIFPTYIRNNGKYEDAYGSCVYYEDSLSMYDDLLKDQDNIINYNVTIMSNTYNSVYETKNKTVYDYLKDTNSSTIFTIEVEDGTLNERIYELGEYAIGEIEKLGFRSTLNIKLRHNDTDVYLYLLMTGEEEGGYARTKESLYEQLTKSNYNNRYLGNVENEFTTVAEGKEVLFKVLSERYPDDSFEYVSEDFYKKDDQETSNLYYYMRSAKYNGCEFEAHLDADGSYHDGYLACAFQDEILHFHDDVIEKDSKVLNHWGSSTFRQYYTYNVNSSFEELIEVNQKNNIRIRVDLNIEIADGTSNEEIYEISKQYIDKMSKKETIGGFGIYVKKNGENHFIYGNNTMFGIDGYYFTEDKVNADLKDNGYENGLK